MDKIGLYLCSFGLLITLIGITVYHSTIVTPPSRIPTDTIHVGIGPKEFIRINRTVFIASVTRSSIIVAVMFESEKLQEYHVYVWMPFLVLSSRPFVARHDGTVYYDIRYPGDRIGEIKSAFLKNVSLVSSVVTASFAPNVTFFEKESPYSYLPKQQLALGVEVSVDRVTAESYQATDTVLLTFFGYRNYDREMEKLIPFDHEEVNHHPFVVQVDFPVEALLSNTYPSPIGYFVTDRFQLATFLMDFAKSGQTVSCSFTYPSKQKDLQTRLFISGILIGTGFPAFVQGVVYILRSKRSKYEASQGRLTKKTSCLAALFVVAFVVVAILLRRKA